MEGNNGLQVSLKRGINTVYLLSLFQARIGVHGCPKILTSMPYLLDRWMRHLVYPVMQVGLHIRPSLRNILVRDL